jgi:hypothetical protein
MAVDLADKAQCEVKLLIALPAGMGDAPHQGEKRGAHGAGRSYRNEQAVHAKSRDQITIVQIACPVSLEKARQSTDIDG